MNPLRKNGILLKIDILNNTKNLQKGLD